MPNRTQWGRAALWLVAAYSVAHFLYSGIYAAWQAAGGDFRSAFPGPLMFQLAERWPSLNKEWIVPWFVDSKVIWNYGPVLHFLTVPLIFAPTKELAMTIVLLVNYALVAATFVLWVRLLFGPRPAWVPMLLIGCLWMNYYPLLEAIMGREIELLEFFLVTAAVWALRHDREGLAGAAVGVATMTKFLPGILLPYLLIKGYRRAFWVALAVCGALAGLAQWLLGFQHSLTFAVLGGEVGTRYFPTIYMRQALINALYRMFAIVDSSQIEPVTLYPDALKLIGTVLQGAILAATAWFIVRWRHSRLLELEVALLLLVAMIILPHANTYYFVFALPALSLGVAVWLRQPEALGALVKGALLGSILLSGVLVPMRVLEPIFGMPGVIVARVWQLYSIPAFGIMLAALVAVAVHQGIRRMEPAGE